MIIIIIIIKKTIRGALKMVLAACYALVCTSKWWDELEDKDLSMSNVERAF